MNSGATIVRRAWRVKNSCPDGQSARDMYAIDSTETSKVST